MTAPPGVGVPGAAPFGAPSAPAGPPPMAPPPAHGQARPDITAGLVTCPICRTPQTGRYCEECGYDYDLAASPQRQSQPPAPGGGYGYPPPAPAPYGQPAQPDPYAQPAPPAQAPYGQPDYGRTPQAPPAHNQPPHNQPPHGRPDYGRPDAYGQQAPYTQAPQFPEPDGSFEQTGPVYAQPGQNGPGDDFGTSFRLAPPTGTPGGPPAGAPAAPPAQPVRTTWMAVVSADRDYFTDMMARSGPEAAGLFFPPYCPERRIPLTGRGQLRIGRRSQHRGTVPEIDLSVPPEDPGASHQHAMLAEQADGSWVLVDQDSTNGTTVNGGAEPVPPHTAIPLNDGDRVHIGAWTTITLHRA
ncbi:FHA domain-containing protein [Kitasatospora kazusensis]